MRPDRYFLCVHNAGFEVSLELRKVYVGEHAEDGMVRIVDESGEPYLFSEDMFVAIVLPARAESAFLAA